MALRRFSVALAVTAGAYSNGDVIGGRLQLHGIGGPPGIRLHNIVIADKAAQSVDYLLTFMDAAPTDIADNAALSTMADADAAKIIWEKTVDAATYRRTRTANSNHEVDGLDQPLMSNEADGDLWLFLSISSGTPTFASTSDVTITLVFSPF